MVGETPRQALPVDGRLFRLDLDEHPVHRVAAAHVQLVVVGKALHLADQVLDRGRIDVDAADGDHEVGAPQHHAWKVGPCPPAPVVGMIVTLNEVVGPVLDERLRKVGVARDDVLADGSCFADPFPGRRVDGVRVVDVLDHVHAACPLPAGLSDLQALAHAVGVVDQLRTPHLGELVPRHRD